MLVRLVDIVRLRCVICCLQYRGPLRPNGGCIYACFGNTYNLYAWYLWPIGRFWGLLEITPPGVPTFSPHSDPVEHFLLYCRIGRSKRAAWRIGQVVRVLCGHRQYTHDACLDGASKARGVSLTAMLYDSPEGRFWHKLSPVSA